MLPGRSPNLRQLLMPLAIAWPLLNALLTAVVCLPLSLATNSFLTDEAGLGALS
jgi:hypothetical protein